MNIEQRIKEIEELAGVKTDKFHSDWELGSFIHSGRQATAL